MARSVKSDIEFMSIPGIAEDQATRTVPHLTNCKGINKSITTEQMSTDDASELENFFLNDAGKLQTRGGTVLLGLVNGTKNVDHLTSYQRGDKTKYLVRWLQDTVEYYSGGAWHAFTGAALGFSANQRVSHAAWGTNTLLFVGDSKVYALDFAAFTVTQVAASPANSQSIYVFGNRAIVCAPGTNYTTVQWSIKNDYTDWTGAGSGDEPLIPGPTGAGDTVLGGFAITDTEAIVIRANSVWMQGITGDPDAPFVFRFLYAISVKDIWSAAVAPGGVFILGTNDVYFLTTSAPESIGDPIKSKYINDIADTYGATVTDPAGAWDEFRKSYYLSLPYNTSNDTGEVLVFNKKYNAWTTFKYPTNVNRLCVMNAPIDPTAPNTYYNRGPIISQNGVGEARILYEDPSTSVDVDVDGALQDTVAFATMAALKSVDWGRRVKFESLTLDLNGGTQSQLTASVVLFAPSKFNDITFETIIIASNTFIQTNRLRQRQTFFGVRERNGIVPKVIITASPMVSLNSVDVTFCDGSPFVPTTVTASDDRVDVMLISRITVDGSQRITA